MSILLIRSIHFVTTWNHRQWSRNDLVPISWNKSLKVLPSKPIHSKTVWWKMDLSSLLWISFSTILEKISFMKRNRQIFWSSFNLNQCRWLEHEFLFFWSKQNTRKIWLCYDMFPRNSSNLSRKSHIQVSIILGRYGNTDFSGTLSFLTTKT